MKITRVTAMWCMSCLSMKKTWKKVFKEYPNIEVTDLDYDFNEAEVKPLNVGKLLPELIVYNNAGLELIRIVGEKSYKEMMELLGGLDEEL